MSDNIKITVVSNDDERFVISRKTAERSVLIKNMLTDLCEDDDDEIEIPIPEVSGKILSLVIQWAEHHKDTVFPKDDDARKSAPIEDWDREFFKKFSENQETLYHMILASNYLNMAYLLDTGCKTVAEMIRGKSPEEIRRTFNILTEEEEAKVKQLVKEHTN